MTGSPQTTTTSPATSVHFEPPEIHIDETRLMVTLSQPLTEENLGPLIYANYLMAMCAYDRRCIRLNLAKIWVTILNFHNHMMRWAQLTTLAHGKIESEGITTGIDYNLAEARLYQAQLIETLKLFAEMRAPCDPVL